MCIALWLMDSSSSHTHLLGVYARVALLMSGRSLNNTVTTTVKAQERKYVVATGHKVSVNEREEFK